MASTRDAPEILRRLARGANGCAIAVLVVGFSVLAGWVFNIEPLKRIGPEWVSMKINTAIGFILAGAGLWWRERKLVRLMTGVLVTLLGGLTLAEHLTGESFGIDQLFYRVIPTGVDAAFPPGRMSPIAAANFIFAGTALLLLQAGSEIRRYLVQILLMGMGSISGVALMAYIFDVPALNRIPYYSPITVYTATAFVLLSAGLLCGTGDGIARKLVDGSNASKLLRLVLPVSVGASILLGWLARLGERGGLYDTNFGIALFAFAEILILMIVVWRAAAWIERETAVGRESEARSHRMIDLAALGLGEADPRTGQLLWVNRKFCEITGYSAVELSQKTFTELTHPDERQHDWEEYERTLRVPGSVYRVEKRYIRKDGSIVWVRVNAAVFDWERDGVPRRAVASIEDITERRRAEEALQRGKTELRIAMEIAQLGQWKWDMLSGEVTWSERCKALYGLSPDAKITYDLFLNLVHPDDRDRVNATIQSALDSRGEYEIEKRIIWPDGSLHWNSSRGRVFRDATGKPTLVTGVTMDITERKKAEESLRVSEERLKQAVRAGGLGIFEHDHRTETIYFSPLLRRLYGWGEDIQVTLPEIIETIHPDDRERVALAIRSAHDPAGEGIYAIEYRQINPDGSIRWVLVRSQTFFECTNSDRHPVRTVGAVLDITKQKQAHEALRRQKEFADAVINSVPGTFYVFDTDGRFLRWNKNLETLTGFSSDEIARMNPLEFFAEQHRSCVVERIREVFESGYSSVDVPLLTKDGRSIPYFFTGVRVFLEPGPCLVGVGTDMADRQRAEEELARLNVELEERVIHRTAELEAANRELEAFSYSVSHDLRAPLRAISGFTDIFIEEFGGPLSEEARQLVGKIQENAKKMNLLINDLLHFSRTSRHPLSVRKVDLASLTRECYEELAPQREGREIEFMVGELPSCHADPTLLRQVMLNLLSNALKYTRDRARARIEVGSMNKEGRVVYYVRDNGAGFDMQYAGNLFGVFQRLHSSSEYEGTGVGLAIVQRVVHRHGGKVWAEADVQKGAIFYFTLEGNREKFGSDLQTEARAVQFRHPC